MKKNLYIIFILLILSACTPQVTVTSVPQTTEVSETSVVLTPTPTLHPEFIELQNLIADSSENLILLSNGQIEENGVVIQNLQVDPNGEISILVEGENIMIDLADTTFEDGFHINGYELQNGEWVAAELTPEEQLDFDMRRLGLSPDKYNVSYDAEGKIELREKSTNKLIYFEGMVNRDEIIKIVVATNSCYSQEFAPESPGANWTSRDKMGKLNDFINTTYSNAVLASIIPPNDGSGKLIPVYFNKTNNCWGLWVVTKPSDGRIFLIWLDNSEDVQGIEVFDPKLHK